MNRSELHDSRKKQLEQLVKTGLVRELFRRGQITQGQFEAMLKLLRA